MTGAMTSAMAPVAAEIMAGLPPRNEIETAIVNDAKSPTLGSTPAMIENEMASGISARATTRPARTSVRRILGVRRACRTLWSGAGASGRDMVVLKRLAPFRGSRQIRRRVRAGTVRPG